VSLIATSVFAFYGVFLKIPLCMKATAKRVSLFSNIGVCPAFVETSLDTLNAELVEALEVGDEAQRIESVLAGVGATYSWDGFQDRYQAIIRHPSSSFHAITIYVYVDEQRRLRTIEVNDSFSAL
nr:hypothetical protein [Gammaproteobacteria bacterium]